MMWLKFMQEWHYNEYIGLRMNGELLSVAHKVDDEAYDLINKQVKKTDYGIERTIIESDVIKEFVLKNR